MSAVTYNGISLGFIRTSTYRNEPVADKDRPDLIYRETTLQFSSVISKDCIPAAGGESTVAVWDRVRHALELPRRSFVYQVNGENVISLPNGDDANGPFPFGVDVTLLANESFLISFGIKIRTADCNGSTRQVLSHRWSESVTINDEHLSTYHRSGRLIVASRAGVNPDSFRTLVTPTIGPKFCRKQAQYTLHENGLELAFDFTDEEQYVMPPFPAIKIAGTMAVSSTDHTGVKRMGRLEVELTGPPDVPKKLLLQRCVEIGMSRATKAGIIRGANGRAIIGGGVHEDLAKNRIKLTLVWMMKAPGSQLVNNRGGSFTGTLISGGAFGAVGIAANLLGASNQVVGNSPVTVNARNQATSAIAMSSEWVGLPLPGTNNGQGVAPPTHGDVSWLQMIASGLRDPCLAQTVNRQPPTNTGIQTELVSANINIVPSLPPEIPGGNFLDREDTFYDYYECTLSYIHDEGVDVAPAMKTRTAGKKFRLSGETMRLEAEFSARRTGKPPVIPDAKGPTYDSNWVYTGGVVAPEMVTLAADGVTPRYTVTGLLRFKALDPCIAKVVSPVPPWLAGTIENEARLAAALRSTSIVFLSGPQGGQPINPFCDTGNAFTAELVADGSTGGGFPFASG